MYLIYGRGPNNNGIVMDVLAFDGIKREMVYSDDQTTLLYTKWTISALALLNPETAYGKGMSPISADLRTRQILSTPRRKLFLVSPSKLPTGNYPLKPNPAAPDIPLDQTVVQPGIVPPSQLASAWTAADIPAPYEVLLECPKGSGASGFNALGGNTTTGDGGGNTPSGLSSSEGQKEFGDAKDGPTPIQLNVEAVHGTGSFVVRFVVQCHVSPDGKDSGFGVTNPPSPVAAHRWKMSFDSDADYWTTRTIDGVVQFRLDYLSQTNESPDDWRAFLAHPVPVGYKRVSAPCSLSEDGSELYYRLVDVEQPCNFNPFRSGATSVHVEESATYSRGPGLFGISLNVDTTIKEAARTDGGPMRYIVGWASDAAKWIRG